MDSAIEWWRHLQKSCCTCHFVLVIDRETLKSISSFFAPLILNPFYQVEVWEGCYQGNSIGCYVWRCFEDAMILITDGIGGLVIADMN